MEKLKLGNVFILGDSYSTFDGYIPYGYASYYNRYDGQPTLSGVDKTWWMRLITESNGNLLLNSSWSGTTVCNTGYDGMDYSRISFVARMRSQLSDGNYNGEKIDTILIFGGTNDFWAGSPRGEIKYSDFSDEDLYCCYPAFSYMLDFLKKRFEKTEIICIINSDFSSDFGNSLVEICEHYGVDSVRLHDIDKQAGHPTEKGMKQISDQISEFIKNKKETIL